MGFISDLFDDIDTKKNKKGFQYTFLSTGIFQRLQTPKTKLFGILSPPMKRFDNVKVEVFEKGLIFKRFKITATGNAK